MTIKTILEEAEKNAMVAMKKSPSKINDDLVFPDERGVYLIYWKKTVIYVGQSSSLRKRFKKHLSVSKETKSSALRRSLSREYGVKPPNTREWMMKNCESSFLGIENPDMCKLVEGLLIAHYRIQNRKLLNS